MQDVLQGLENASRTDIDVIEKSAGLLIESGHREGARQLLTMFSHARAAEAVSAGRKLVDALDSYVQLTGRWRSPVGDEIDDAGEGAETVNCLVGLDPDQPIWKQRQQSTRKRRVAKAKGRSFSQLPVNLQGL